MNQNTDIPQTRICVTSHFGPHVLRKNTTQCTQKLGCSLCIHKLYIYNIPQERNAWTSNQSIFVFVTKQASSLQHPLWFHVWICHQLPPGPIHDLTCWILGAAPNNWLMAAGLFRYFPYGAIYQFADNWQTWIFHDCSSMSQKSNTITLSMVTSETKHRQDPLNIFDTCI